MLDYNPTNWYWIVGGSTTQVYSSAVGDYVPVDNPAYTAWLAAGGVPSRIDTAANLGEVLAPLSLRPTAPDVLGGYTDSQAAKLTIAVVAKVLMSHENRIRVLEGKTALTANQFKTAIKALL